MDLCNVFGLSREAKQNATLYVVFMLCCRKFVLYITN